MKIVRIFCNILLFFVTTVLLSLIQIGVYDVVSLQSSKVDGIHIAGNEEEVGYTDSFKFWFDDIATSVKMEPKHRVRGWLPWSWWKTGMKWADSTVDAVIAVVKPVVVPVAQVNALANYHGLTINDFEEDLMYYYEDYEKANNALYELYYIFNEGYGNPEEIYVFQEENAEPIKLSDYEYTGELTIIDADDVTYSKWIDTGENDKLYNHNWKLKKYNSTSYKDYFTKFIDVDPISGERNIKTPIVVLYYQQYAAMIIALIFVIKYPVGLWQARFSGKSRREE